MIWFWDVGFGKVVLIFLRFVGIRIICFFILCWVFFGIVIIFINGIILVINCIFNG